jgi:hypothetical protein
MSGHRLQAVPKLKKAGKRKTKVAPSIMQVRKECYITGATKGLHRHEIFFGADKRQLSLEWGCWIYLRHDWHTNTTYCVHLNPELDKRLKREAQQRFEQMYGRERFMAVFQKNYLEE